MTKVDREPRTFHAASPEELAFFDEADRTPEELLAARREIGEKITGPTQPFGSSGYSDAYGYTDAATFRAVMLGQTASAGDELGNRVFSRLERYRHTEGEPLSHKAYNFPAYAGVVLRSPFSDLSGEDLDYDITRVHGESYDNPDDGQSFWGQAVLREWHVGTSGRRDISSDWAFFGAHELAVVRRAITDSEGQPQVLATAKSFTDLVGMEEITKYWVGRDPESEPYLEPLFKLAREEAARQGVQDVLTTSVQPPRHYDR